MKIGLNLAWDTTNQLRYDLLTHTLNLDMIFHNTKKPGEMIERIDGDVLLLSNFFSVLILYVGKNLFLIVAILTSLFIENWIIGLSFTTFTIISLYFMIRSSQPAAKYWGKFRESSAKMLGFIEERLAGKEDIRANGGVEGSMKDLHNHLNDNARSLKKAISRSNYIRIVVRLIVAISTILVYMIGIPLKLSGVLTLGGVYLIADYIRLLTDPILNIGFQTQQLQQADAAIDRASELFSIQKNLQDTGSPILPTPNSDIEFANLNFEYVKNEPVLSNINLKIESGQKIGLIGRTGSGKTTLIRLLFRLYDPVSGCITIAGNDIKEISLDNLRNNVAMVTQTVEIFNGTVRDNITLFNPDITDDQILDAIQKVGLNSWFDNLEGGLETVLTRGEGLSAGEAQLLAFTRIFLKNPQIVILDEASSRLDPATEILIEHAVSEIVKNRTAIIIAHKLETLEQVDKILIIHEGKILEYGVREHLANDINSKYYQFVQGTLEEVIS